MKNKKKIGILGFGEIGASLAKVYNDHKEKFEVLIKDLERDDGLDSLDVLNICIPYTENFVEIVKNQICKSNPDLTIVHSTVMPGTTQKIKLILENKFKIVHSPIRGVHPELYEGIKTFVKY